MRHASGTEIVPEAWHPCFAVLGSARRKSTGNVRSLGEDETTLETTEGTEGTEDDVKQPQMNTKNTDVLFSVFSVVSSWLFSWGGKSCGQY